MSMKDRAAICLQATFRGFRWRKKQRRCVKAVIKLQALQRGRFTRREFATLRDFSREQESFQQATRRRQLRIWHREQELYFLQHTNASDLEQVRLFQQQHAARLIQRRWRAVNMTTITLKEEDNNVIAPSDRVYTFDPFKIATFNVEARADRFLHWRRDFESTETSRRAAPLESNKDFRAVAFTQKLPAAIASKENFASRRNAIQERIKQKVAQKKGEAMSGPRASCQSDLIAGSISAKNRRRELYQQVVAMKHTTTQRVLQHKRSYASRREEEMLSARLVATCENQIKHLQSETPDQMTALQKKCQVVHDATKVTAKWDPARRIRAWNHHRRAVSSVLAKCHWWQTHLAGDERDIRQVVMIKSPWEDATKIWSWPRSKSSKQEGLESNDDETDPASPIDAWPSTEIQRFLLGDQRPQNQRAELVDDNEASEWWKAHCTQSHLAINGALLIKGPYCAEFRRNFSSNGDDVLVCTTEMVANRDLYKTQRDAKCAARLKIYKQDVEQRATNLVTRVEQHVHEIEVKVEANTHLALEFSRRKIEQRVQRTREQHSAVMIQRYARGMQGRKHAREVRAEVFVMVRGRAIRRGRCEECGDQRAVLECQQCEESLHFCPICWVHVHSTRRRKTHVAIPMTSVVAPTPQMGEISRKYTTLRAPTADLTAMSPKSIEDKRGSSMRALLSPLKQSATQTAEPIAVAKNMPTAQTLVKSYKQVNAVPLELVKTRHENTTPEFVEACALAQSGSVEVREPQSTANILPNERKVTAQATRNLSIQSVGGDRENLTYGEIDFSASDDKGDLMNGEGDRVEQSEALEALALAPPVSTATSEQYPVIDNSMLPDATFIQKPERSLDDLDLQNLKIDETGEKLPDCTEAGNELKSASESAAETEASLKEASSAAASSTESMVANRK